MNKDISEKINKFIEKQEFKPKSKIALNRQISNEYQTILKPDKYGKKKPVFNDIYHIVSNHAETSHLSSVEKYSLANSIHNKLRGPMKLDPDAARHAAGWS